MTLQVTHGASISKNVCGRNAMPIALAAILDIHGRRGGSVIQWMLGVQRRAKAGRGLYQASGDSQRGTAEEDDFSIAALLGSGWLGHV